MPIIILFPFALLLAFIAWKKNRNPWLWGVIGSFVFLPALVLLFINQPLCPACGREVSISDRRLGKCSGCSEEMHFRFSGKFIEYRGVILFVGIVAIIVLLLIFRKV